MQALLVYDQVIEDSPTKKDRLIGLCTHLQSISFLSHRRRGGLSFGIDLIYINYEQLVCRATLPNITIVGPLQISDFEINIPSQVLLAPRRYEFRLSIASLSGLTFSRMPLL